MVIGGSALTATLQGLAAEQGITAVAGYGMSETVPVVSVARGSPIDEGGASARRAAGLPIPLVHTSVVDERMKPVPHDGVTPGELVLRAPWLTDGYLGQAQANDDLWQGGWMHTQDIATIDGDGTIVIRDRLKDIIKTGGEWLSSLELEHLILQRPGVSQVAVIGVPDEKWGERPVAYIVTDDEALTASIVREHLQAAVADGRLVRFGVPDRIVFVDALPTTTVGKIDKKSLRERFQSDVDFATEERSS